MSDGVSEVPDYTIGGDAVRLRDCPSCGPVSTQGYDWYTLDASDPGAYVVELHRADAHRPRSTMQT